MTEIDLSNQNADTLPSYIIIELMPRLISLILRDNKINKFDAQILLKACPQLEILDFSNNQIDELEDLVQLGALKQLKILQISDNPVCKTITRLNILEVLINPQKYRQYDPVKILCAGYIRMPQSKLTQKEKVVYQQEMKMVQKNPEELEANQLRGTVSKHNHKRTLARFGSEECPVPRKTRFPNLSIFNGQIITKLDMMRILTIDDVSQILYSPEENQMMRSKSAGKPIRKQNSALQNEYLRKYKKRIEKMYQANEDGTMVKKLEGEDEMHYLAKVDQASAKVRNFKINPQIFAQEIWEKPLDVQNKGAEFNILMKDYKKLCNQYEIDKKKQEEKQAKKEKERKQKNMDKVNKKLAAMGIPDFKDYPEIEDDSDVKVRKLFRVTTKKMKPQLDLAKADEMEYDSSQSELSERINKEERQSDFNESDLSDMDTMAVKESESEINNQKGENQTQTGQQKHNLAKKLQDDVEKKNENSLMDLRNQILEKNKNKQDAGIPRVKRMEKEASTTSAASLSTNTNNQSSTQLLFENQEQLVEGQTHIDDQYGLTSQQKDRQQNLQYMLQGSSIKMKQAQGEHTPPQTNNLTLELGVGPKGDQVKMIVSNFEFDDLKNPKDIQQKKKALAAQEIREQTRSSFDVRNQLFVHHENAAALQTNSTQEASPSNTKKSIFPPQREENEGGAAQKEKEIKKAVFFKDDTSFSKLKRNKDKDDQTEFIIRQKGQINLNEIQYPRTTINIESLIPYKEQGGDETFQQAILYNPNSKEHKELKLFKKNIEEIQNLREQTKVLNDMIENPSGADQAAQFKSTIMNIKKKISYDKGFEYLLQDKNFQVQNTFDPVQKYVREFITKTNIDDGKFSTHDIREIFLKANGYDADKQEPITEKEVNQVLEDHQKQFAQKLIYYQWNETLDEIRLRKNQPSEKNLKRMQLQQIQRTKSNANLAVHYQMLSKYVDDEQIQKELKKLTTGMFNENKDKIVFKKEKEEDPPYVDNRLKRLENQLGSNHSKNTMAEDSQKDLRAEKNGKQQGFVGHLEELEQEKRQVRPYQPRPDVNLQGYIVEFCPNINEIVNDQKYVPPPQDLQAFEERVDFYQRQIQEKFQQNQQDSGVLSLENQILQYAQQFQEKVEQRQQLKTDINNYIKESGKQLDQFIEWEQKELALRNDKEYCFLRYVQLQREGQIN